MRKGLKKASAIICSVTMVAASVVVYNDNNVKADDEKTTIVAYQYDNTEKTADTDLDEYLDANDPNQYTYVATTGTGSLLVSITGTAYKHITWSKDTYTNGAEESVGIVPAIGASSKNNWSADVYADFTFSTTDCTELSLSLDIGATKKGPKNFKLTYVDEEGTEQVIGETITLADNKTMYTTTVDLPKELENQETVSIKLKLADTTAMNGTDLVTNQTGGEFAVNNFIVTGIKAGDDTSEETSEEVSQEESSGEEVSESESVEETSVEEATGEEATSEEVSDAEETSEEVSDTEETSIDEATSEEDTSTEEVSSEEITSEEESSVEEVTSEEDTDAAETTLEDATSEEDSSAEEITSEEDTTVEEATTAAYDPGFDVTALVYQEIACNGADGVDPLTYAIKEATLEGIVPWYGDGGVTFMLQYADPNAEGAKAEVTVNGEAPAAGVITETAQGLVKVNPTALPDDSYTVVTVALESGKSATFVIKKGNPVVEPKETTADETNESVEVTTVEGVTTKVEESTTAADQTTPAEVTTTAKETTKEVTTSKTEVTTATETTTVEITTVAPTTTVSSTTAAVETTTKAPATSKAATVKV